MELGRTTKPCLALSMVVMQANVREMARLVELAAEAGVDQELRRRVNGDEPPLICQHCFVYRKTGNAGGVFMHHLTDGYDLWRDLFERGYADEFRKRFLFARACEGNAGGCCGGGGGGEAKNA